MFVSVAQHRESKYLVGDPEFMSQPRVTFMPDLLVEHYEELSFLWGQRTAALRSSSTTLQALRALEERIAAHVEGLLVGGGNSVGVVESGLVSTSTNEVFAAAYTMLSLNDANTTDKVLKAFLTPASESALRGICEALCVGLVGGFVNTLEDALLKAGPLVALAVQEVFAFHWPEKLAAVRIRGYLVDHDPVLRGAAWRVAYLRPELVTAEQTEAAVSDESPGVRWHALQVAAWAGHRWVMEDCRKAMVSPGVEKADELYLLCTLGIAADAPGILGLVSKRGLGAFRFRLLGSYAQASAVDGLIQGMIESDPMAASAAGTAFARITGHELRVTRREKLPPADGTQPDAFEEQFLEEVELPDALEAAEYWEANRARFQPGLRYSQGLPLPETAPFSEGFDIVSIRETCLRAAFHKKAEPKLADLNRFPIVL